MGDRNTKFFHVYASNRKKKNTLKKLRDDLGMWVEYEGISKLVVHYFEHVFSSNSNHFGDNLEGF